MYELLVRLALAVPQDDTPPVKCDLVNKVKGGTADLVGNVIGLQDLAPWIIGVLFVAAVLVAAIPKLRRIVIANLMWIIAIVLVGGAVLGAVFLFAQPHC